MVVAGDVVMVQEGGEGRLVAGEEADVRRGMQGTASAASQAGWPGPFRPAPHGAPASSPRSVPPASSHAVP